MFDLDGAEARSVATVNEVRVSAPAAPTELAFPPLFQHRQMKHRRDLRKELRRRDLLGDHVDLGGGLALRHAHPVVHDGGRVDLHRDRIGIGGIQAVEVQDLFEIEEHPLDAPAVWIQGDGVGRRQPVRVQHIGEHLVAPARPAPADMAQGQRRGAGAGADFPVVQAPTPPGAFTQAPLVVQLPPALAPYDAPAPLALQRREEGARTIQPIPEHERLRRQALHHREGPGQFAGGRIRLEGQGPTQAVAEVIHGEQTHVSGQNDGALVPQQLQPPGNRAQPRPIDEHQRGEARPHRRQFGGVAGRHRGQQPLREVAEYFGKERRPQTAAPLEERFRRRTDGRIQRDGLVPRLGQGLTQGVRSVQHDRNPEPRERVERPGALPLGAAHAPECRATHRRRQMFLQQGNQPIQVDRWVPTSAHSTSRGWGFYGLVNPTGCDFWSSYLSGDVVKDSSGGHTDVNIIAYNPGHDGAIAYLKDAHLLVSIEAEKNSNYRYSPISSHDVFNVLGEFDEMPDAICTGGWWPREKHLLGSHALAGYRGVLKSDCIVDQRRLLGRPVQYFSSSHERSHLLCAFGMSSLPKGTPCYALVWEGAIGAFYEIDSELNITLLADVLNEPGNRYTSVYGLADPTFPKNAPFSRFSDAGKLMALASFAKRSTPSAEEKKLIEFLLDSPHVPLSLYEDLEHSRYYNVGVDDPEFRNFAGIFSDKIFDIFYQFAKANMKKRMPLVIAGGCGLNCDWNTKWKETGLFPEVFVPPVANDSGSAIGTAIDAQFHFTENPKIDWNVYSGLGFIAAGSLDLAQYDLYETNYEMIADMLANDLIIGWVSGKYEIGPRALGNRSILAAPFRESTRVRLNEIKQREQFRPIAPVCLEEEAERWFGCDQASPFMLYTHRVRTNALAAVTHVNGTARVQTVSYVTNRNLYALLIAFKACTGYGVLCNTSLNFNGRGFINTIADLSAYAVKHNLDGFVVEGRTYLLKSSRSYQAYLAGSERRPSRR